MKIRGEMLCALICLALASCTGIPTSGPNARDIVDGAAASALESQRRPVAFDYVLLDINRTVLDRVVAINPGAFFTSFGRGRGPSPVIRVGVGDVVQVVIFEFERRAVCSPPSRECEPATSLPSRRKWSTARVRSRSRLRTRCRLRGAR